jgi:hypothetical protein
MPFIANATPMLVSAVPMLAADVPMVTNTATAASAMPVAQTAGSTLAAASNDLQASTALPLTDVTPATSDISSQPLLAVTSSELGSFADGERLGDFSYSFAGTDSGQQESAMLFEQQPLPQNYSDGSNSLFDAVFERMQAEREREIKTLLAKGDAEASSIRSEADRARNEILAAADGQATQIRGQAEAAASASLQVFNKAPDLAIFLQQLNAMVDSLKERSTLILDERTSPFNLLSQPAHVQPETKR